MSQRLADTFRGTNPDCSPGHLVSKQMREEGSTAELRCYLILYWSEQITCPSLVSVTWGIISISREALEVT